MLCYVFRFEKTLMNPLSTMKTTHYSSVYKSTHNTKDQTSINTINASTKKHYKNLFEFAYDPHSGKIVGGDKASEVIEQQNKALNEPIKPNSIAIDVETPDENHVEVGEVLNDASHISNQIEQSKLQSPVSFKKQEVSFMEPEERKSSRISPTKKGHDNVQPPLSEGYYKNT